MEGYRVGGCVPRSSIDGRMKDTNPSLCASHPPSTARNVDPTRINFFAALAALRTPAKICTSLPMLSSPIAVVLALLLLLAPAAMPLALSSSHAFPPMVRQ